MIILRSKLIETPEEFDKPLIVVHINGGDFVIERNNAGEGDSLRLSIDDVQPWACKYFYWSFTGHGFIESEDFSESRDADSFMRSRYGCTEGPVLVVARGGSDELALVVTQPAHTDLPFVQYDKFGPSIDAVDTVIPGFASSDRARANKAKRDLLGQINPVSVLAEQEKQIDLLSMLVIALAEKQPEDERPEWLPQFKAVIEQGSSLQFKGPAKAIEDIAERKAHIRALQEQYFKAKSGVA